jgi:glycogen operon protein
MLTAGDELGHGQDGNNNPYCQENETTWIAWSQADEALIDFTARLLALRRELLPLAPHWYTGRPDAHGLEDLVWLRSDGERLQADDWALRGARALAAFIRVPGKATGPLLLITNPHADELAFALPPGTWRALLDSARPDVAWDWRGSTPYPLAARSVVLLAAAQAAA